MFINYFKIAWRNAQKNKSFTLISLFSLVLGISLFFVISIWVEDELSYDKGFAQAENIFRLETNLTSQDGSESAMQTVGWPVGVAIKENYPEVEDLTYMRSWSPVITLNNNRYYEDCLMADESFFEVFGYELEEGSTKDALKNPNSIVLSKKLKEKYFGNKNALGEVLILSDTIPYKITGVLKDITNPSHLRFDVIGSFSTLCSNNPEYCASEFASGWFDVNVYNYLRLKSNTNKSAVSEKVSQVVMTFGKEAVEQTGYKTTLYMRPLKDIYLKSGMPTALGTVGNIKSVKLFLAVGIFILFIACLNFINLKTASSMERAKEIGIKKVLGGNRRNLITQFLVEAGVLCLLATIISIVFIIVALPYFNQFTGKDFNIIDLFTVKRVAILIGILVVLIPLSGFYPALVMSSFKPIKVLKGHFAHSVSGNNLRKGLVIFQFVVSIAFIMSSLVIDQQMNYMQSENLGFDKDHIIMVDMDKVPWTVRHSKSDVFKNNLSSQNGITKVSGSAAIPGRTGWAGQFAYPEGKSKDAGLTVEYIPVDYEYVETLGLNVIEGRNFIKDSEVDKEESVLINEAAVELFGWGNSDNAIGKTVETSGKKGKVVGVLKDYHQHGLQDEINPLVIGLANFIRIIAISYDTSEKNAVAAITNSWNEVYKDYPLEYSFMDEVLQRQYEKEEKLSSFFKLATVLSILIACLGLLGLSIYTAQKRIKEIGVRKVLGASVANIVGLLSKDFLQLVVLSIIIASPIAWYFMQNWLEEFAYRINLNWWVFILAGMVAITIAFFTIGYHALRAALANPSQSLRTE